MEAPNVLSPEQIAQIDRAYRPIGGFEEWAGLPVDEALWGEYAAALAKARERGSVPAFERAVRGAMRAAAFDSGAIEGLYPADRGFTITAAFQASVWENGLRERGQATAELVSGQLRGYELALDVATRRMPVTEAWIRAVHEEVTAGQPTYTVRTALGDQQQAMPRGVYKTSSNHVRLPGGEFHAYAPPEMVGPEMHRLVAELSGPTFEAAHPATQAAYVHHALTQIHPFADGNGRVARIVASVFLLRAQSIPLVVFADQREEYLAALRRADAEDRAAFLGFVFDRSIDTLDLLSNLVAADVESSVERLAAMYRVRDGVTILELEEATGALLTRHAIDELQSVFASLPSGVTGSLVWTSETGQPAPVAGYRLVTQRGSPMTTMMVGFVSAAPRAAGVNLTIRALLSNDPLESMPLMLHEERTGSSFRARISDVMPTLTESATTRLRAWIGRLVATSLSELAAAAEQISGTP